MFRKMRERIASLNAKYPRADSVWLEKDFFEKGKGAPCRKIVINKSFSWGNNSCFIPAVYYCREGIVVDQFFKIPTAKFQGFLDKWQITEDNPDAFTQEQLRQIEKENPMNIEFSSFLTVDGKKLRNNHCHYGYWTPLSNELNAQNADSKKVLDYYKLDASFCWVLRRITYTPQKGELLAIPPRKISLTLSKTPSAKSCGTFVAEKAGETVKLLHPVSGEEFTLTVVDIKAENIDALKHMDDALEYPTYLVDMAYAVPEGVTNESFRITDSAPSDEPRLKVDAPSSNGVDINGSVAAIGIIGGADGPTAVFVGSKKSDGNIRHALSSLRFEPTEKIVWQADFYIKEIDDISVDII